jgi:thiamine biosynthesis lipoprotein
VRIAILICGLILSHFAQASAKRVVKSLPLMGSVFEFTAVHEDTAVSILAIAAAITEVERIESLISSWKTTSETSLINKNAGIEPVQVSKELFTLIERCKKIGDFTNGAFDITCNVLFDLWKFDGSMKSAPSDEAINEKLKLIGYQQIVLDATQSSVFLPKKGMQIGFGAIGKGYAANKAQALMKKMGISGGIVNAGGDLSLWGYSEFHSPWRIGVQDPKQANKIMSWLSVTNMAVVTSGDYERFVEFDGIRYAHIMNPKTGWPVRGVISVSIHCPDAELADALATSVFVMGVKEGIQLINKMEHVEGFIMDDKGVIFASEGIDLNYEED